MTDSKPDETLDSSDEVEDDDSSESVELETLTREDEWGDEAFRDTGDATFGDS